MFRRSTNNNLEWLNNVILIALEKVCPCLADFLNPFPANGEPAPGHSRCAIGYHEFIEFKIVLHNVNTVVPIQWIVEQDGISLFDWSVGLCNAAHINYVVTATKGDTKFLEIVLKV